MNPHEECERQSRTQQARDNHFGSGDNLQNIVNNGVRGMKMEERRKALLPDQKQHKEDDGKKKLWKEGEERSLALEKKLHTKMKTEEKERRKENLAPEEERTEPHRKNDKVGKENMKGRKKGSPTPKGKKIGKLM